MAGEWLASASKYHVTIIRVEGSNGVMTAVMYAAGFEPWDVRDLLSGRITLEGFRGIMFVGGFSYADVLESARGWAATILNSKELKAQLDAFYARPNTFSTICPFLEDQIGTHATIIANMPFTLNPIFSLNISSRSCLY